MKGLYNDCLVEIKEKLPGHFRVETVFGNFMVKQGEVIEIPDTLYQQHEEQLKAIEKCVNDGRERIQDITRRFIAKKEEINDTIDRAKLDRMLIISRLKEESIKAMAGEGMKE